jgi:cellulose synthase/poly-beta-1,6-N-acetylglucosamine synthase-like glycosyltransferase
VSPVKLSALVCAQNDEARLAECLRRLDFCDEIVVVADRCTDRSAEIARQHGARVLDGIFPLESQRKAAGVAACLGEWVFEVEADERVEHALAYEVRAAIHGRPGGDWYNVPVHNFVGERLVRRGWGAGLGDMAAPKLYRRRVKRWKARRVEPIVTMDGRYAGAIETPLIRLADADLGQMLARLDGQTRLRAQDLVDAGKPGDLMSDIARGVGRFVTCYVWRQGLREGEMGFLVSLMAGLEAVLSGMRARELMGARAAAPSAPAAQPAQFGFAARR